MTILAPNALHFLYFLYALLIVATGVIYAIPRFRPGTDASELKDRIKSWWLMIGVFTVAMLLNETGSLFFMAFVSFLALKEYLSMIPTRRADRRVLALAYLAIPLQYLWIGMPWYGMFIIFIPVYMFLLIPAAMAISGETRGYLRAAGTIHWGLMTCVFAISHAAALLTLPGETTPSIAGGAGLLLYLMFLTEGNDVAQYIWGKMFGRRKAVPTVSPNKTVEGLLGGVATTTVFAVILAPLLTPIGFAGSIAAGLLIGFAGFLGDTSISAIKRDIGVKDSSSLIPGHGGILDRIDSLTFTAPLFFHFIRYFYF